MSQVSATPLCTPPAPPVTNTLIPAYWAQIMVAATVVDPFNFLERTMAMSLLEVLVQVLPSLARYSIWSFVSPIQILPYIMAMVAGMAPPSFTQASTSKAVFMF